MFSAIVSGAHRLDRGAALQQAHIYGFVADGDGEVIASHRARVAPMKDGYAGGNLFH